MKPDEVNKIAQLRRFAVECYEGLDGKGSAGVSMMKQEDTANMLSSIVKSLDDLLRPYVKFE